MLHVTIIWAMTVGQTMGESQETLSLEQAISITLAYHEDVQIADERTLQVQARKRQVWARVLPHATASASLARARTLSGKATTAYDNGDRNTRRMQFGVQSVLVDLGALPDLWRASDALRAQRLNSAEVKRALAFQLAEQFLLVLATERLRDAAKKRLEVADATVQDAQRRVEAGLGRVSDVTRAKLERSSAYLSVVETARDVDLGRLLLGELLGTGKQPLGRRTLAPPGDTLLPPAWTWHGVETRAAATRNDLQEAQARANALEHAVLENLASYLPTVGIEAGLSDDRVRRLQETQGVETSSETEIRAWQLSLQLTWQLFRGGHRLAEDTWRRSEAKIGRLEVQQLARRIAREVQSARRRLEAHRVEEKEAATQAFLAARNLADTRSLFQHGLSTALERVDAIGRAFEADTKLAQRRLQTQLGELAILKAVGAWPVGGVEQNKQ